MSRLRTELTQDAVYRKVVNGREDLWDEYCRFRKEVKQLVIEKNGISLLRK